MNRTTALWHMFLILASALILAGCGGSTAGGASTLNVGTPGDQLVFDPATLRANTSAQITVTFKNNASTLQHNWVLVKGGDDVAASVATEGNAAGAAKGYIPDDTANIIAHTKLLDAGQSESVTFTTPAPGSYAYVCTVPGHYQAGMKGTLTTQ